MQVVIAGAGPAEMLSASERHGRASIRFECDQILWGGAPHPGFFLFAGRLCRPAKRKKKILCGGLRPSQPPLPQKMVTLIRFPLRLPTPLNGLAGVAKFKAPGSSDKLRMRLGLLCPIFGDQACVDRQDDETHTARHLRHAMGRRIVKRVESGALRLEREVAGAESALN